MTDRSMTGGAVWGQGLTTYDNSLENMNNTSEKTKSVKDINYRVQSAKSIFLFDSLLIATWKLMIALATTTITILLKKYTPYWVVAFLIVLPFTLTTAAHLLTVLFEYALTRFKHG